MPGWPWPDEEVKWFTARARRALDGHPRPGRLISAVLVHLATHDVGDGPVRNLSVWAKKYSLRRLREYIEAFDAPGIRELAEAEAGVPRRRGDLVQLRTKATWWDIRTK